MKTTFLHVESARYAGDHRVDLQFSDGLSGTLDLLSSLDGEVFAPLQDPARFRHFRLEGGTLSWDNGADFAPEFLHGLLSAKTD